MLKTSPNKNNKKYYERILEKYRATLKLKIGSVYKTKIKIQIFEEPITSWNSFNTELRLHEHSIFTVIDCHDLKHNPKYSQYKILVNNKVYYIIVLNKQILENFGWVC
jgi:hypothetical protein